MTEKDNILIQKALTAGIERPEWQRAKLGQSLTYILSRSSHFHHGNIKSASAERYFLQAALGRKIRIFKIWNIGRTAIKDDLSLLRGMLDETEHWDPAFEALDRILQGAGF